MPPVIGIERHRAPVVLNGLMERAMDGGALAEETDEGPRVHVGEVEGEHIQFPAIHNQDFAVIADQVSRCARDCDATLQKPHLQLAQARFATTIGECDQGMDR